MGQYCSAGWRLSSSVMLPAGGRLAAGRVDGRRAGGRGVDGRAADTARRASRVTSC